MDGNMPEKIYLFDYNDAMVTPIDGDTTYVKEDAFIEKMAEWCYSNPVEEPASENLKEAANEIVNKAIPPLAQKHKDGTYVGGIRDYFDRKEFVDLVKAGAEWQKQQMMANAIDTEVKVDAGGYPYVDRTIELYDYDREIPLAKKGDKVKVIVIKDE